MKFFPRLLVSSLFGVIVVVGSAATQAAPASAQLAVNRLPAPTVAMAFNPSTIVVGQTSTLTITLTNPNAAPVTGVAFTDTYPAGVINGTTPNPSTTCGGGIVPAFPFLSLSMNDGTIPANGSCTVTVTVAGVTTGNKVNTIDAGAVTSGNAQPNAAPATATLVVNLQAPPGVTKTIVPGVLTPGQTALMTITISNPNPAQMGGVGFTDTYPSGLVNANPPGAATTCFGNAMVTAAAGGSTLVLAGGAIDANGTCAVSVRVTAGLSGAYMNTIPAGGVTSFNAQASTAAAAAAVVVASSIPVPALSQAALGLLLLLLGALGMRSYLSRRAT